MIGVAPIATTEGGGTLSAALVLFSSAFSDFEEADIVVRDFTKASPSTILVFGYLIEAVREAAVRERFERRNIDHTSMLEELSSYLSWAGHAEAATAALSRIDSAFRPNRSGESFEKASRQAHMRRYARFAMSVFEEMDQRGIWPATHCIDLYRLALASAVKCGDTPSYLLDVREVVDDLADQVRPTDAEAASRIIGYRTWKRRLY